MEKEAAIGEKVDSQISQTPAENATRVESLWFPDHGLVLQAGNRLFRLPTGILAARSSVFNDMLLMPQPETQPMLDGCPIVVLQDLPADAEYFLTAIFDSSFFEPPPYPTTFPIISAVLKLSTKYDVEYLRHRALLHLASASPRSLSEYVFLPSARTFPLHYLEFPYLLLAHDFGLSWALPAAMYDACRLEIADLVDGIPVDGGRVKLSPSLQRKCLAGRETLLAQSRDAFRFLRAPQDDCTDAACLESRLRLLDVLMENDLMDSAKTQNFWEGHRPAFCAACGPAVDAASFAAIHEIWEGLPVLFELGTWEQLDAARTADLA
ncbi:hypothetical protein DFH07DRAFT_1065283 [Mycena maculata]|uniref:BTB domain-containing protein n=1 Tax=Mycena maculata TaxID=230809 RepID=A0AAD7I389_9AGAR|nr:hypothetical protein DFH07DRAFT_1065283 [Mycena maculata]